MNVRPESLRHTHRLASDWPEAAVEPGATRFVAVLLLLKPWRPAWGELAENRLDSYSAWHRLHL